MSTRTVEQVDEWESRPFSGGYRGLHDLADEEFSGIVTVGPTRLCMTKGAVVGILEGSIDDFEDASGTAHEAPSPALPLLAVMQERADEVRAQYYSEETPIRKVDQTLTDGNFTGFIELSENVLSGDYYVVYHQGRSMSVAFVGESKKLLTEDEAFERADGEVGIYEVKPVDIEPVEIPDSGNAGGDTTGATGAAGAAGAGAAASTADGATDDGGAPDESTSATDTDTDVESAAADATERDETTGDREDDPEPASTPDGTTRDESATGAEARTSADDRAGADRTDESNESSDAGTRERSGDRDRDRGRRREQEQKRERDRDRDLEPTERTESPADRDRRGARRERETAAETDTVESDSRRSRDSGPSQGSPDERSRTTGSRSGQGDSRSGTGRDSQPSTGGASGGGATPADAVGQLETRSIPSIDPERTVAASDDGGAAAGGTPPGQPQGPSRGQQGPQGRERDPATNPNQSPEPEPESEPEPDPAREAARGVDPGEVDRLEAELAAAKEERDDLRAERDELREERDELRERIEDLERRINDLRTGEGGESIADRRRLGPAEAIEETNLFIRYKSKGDATLKAAHDGRAEATAVNDNLQIQHHTQFEADDAAVNGEPFDDFLHGTPQYQFVEWVVRVLPYEIRDTGHEGALKDVYDALPRIDRAELNGSITVQYLEDGEEHRSQERFDVVLRDRMGNPLAVANLNDSREPATQNMMESLITAAQRVGESKESLAGAFLVTSSFFQPEAMEAAADATGGGLLSRDKRESFVKLSRKEGFHLCLVEAREDQFNLSVPEL